MHLLLFTTFCPLYILVCPPNILPSLRQCRPCLPDISWRSQEYFQNALGNPHRIPCEPLLVCGPQLEKHWISTCTSYLHFALKVIGVNPGGLEGRAPQIYGGSWGL